MKFRRCLLPLVCSAFLIGSFGANAEDSVLRSFGVGADRSDVGILAGGEDLELEGPQAIFSGDDGQIYLLDQVNHRILKYSSVAGGAPQVLTLPPDVAATDLVVSNGAVHVWDGRILTLEFNGPADGPTRGLSLSRSTQPPDEFTVDAFAQMGSTKPTEDLESVFEPTRSFGSTDRGKQFVASRGRGPVVASFSPLGGAAGVRIAVAPKNGGAGVARLDLQVRSKLGAVDLLDIDTQGRFFVFAENIPTELGDKPSTFVARFAANGSLDGIYELPLTATSGLSRRFVTVSPDGEVFFLRNRKGASDVLAIGFQRVLKGQPIGRVSQSQTFGFGDFPKVRGANAAVRPLTRQQVITIGAAYANIKWRVSASAYGADPDTRCSGFNRIRRPGYLAGKLNQEVVGIPYCWGCQGNLATIGAQFSRGMLAGNVCTRNDPRRDVAGVDCSSFVSATWGLSTHFTTAAIPAITHELPSGWDLKPGDALNKPGSHVMLFIRFTPDKKAEVLEASPNACNGRVCRSVYPLGSLLARGYRPVRYRALLDDAPMVAGGSPPSGAIRR